MTNLLAVGAATCAILGLMKADTTDSDIKAIAAGVPLDNPVLIQRVFTSSTNFFWEIKPDTSNGDCGWRLVIIRTGDKWSIRENASVLPKSRPTKEDAKRFELSMLELRRQGLLKAPMLVVAGKQVTRFSSLPLTPGGFVETTVGKDGKVVAIRGE